MKIEELKQLIQQTDAAQKSAWEKFQTAEASVKPFKDEWSGLYSQVQNLRQKLAAREDIEREMAEEKEAA
jgi:antirestriction protein